MKKKWEHLLSLPYWYQLALKSKKRTLSQTLLRILLLTQQGFTKSQITQGASTLTYYTLLALVPLFALMLGIARGFLYEQTFEGWLLDYSSQDEVVKQILQFASASLSQASKGVIAGVGVFLFLWSGIKILTHLENVMNQIWEVRGKRTFANRFSNYLALLLLAPLIVLFTSGFTLYFYSLANSWTQEGNLLRDLGPLFIFIMNALPYLLTCLLLVFLYIMMPTTRVNFIPALIAGFVTGTLYQFFLWLYLYFQIGVSNYNAIYGTFAAFPLFLIWLQLSWVIVLLGAKISFAIQNREAFFYFREDMALSRRLITLQLLRMTHVCVKKFISGLPPPTPVEISNTLSIPLSLTAPLIRDLVNAGLLSETKRIKDQAIGFLPAIDVENLTIKRTLDMINSSGGEIPLPPSKDLLHIQKCLSKFDMALENSPANILLKEI